MNDAPLHFPLSIDAGGSEPEHASLHEDLPRAVQPRHTVFGELRAQSRAGASRLPVLFPCTSACLLALLQVKSVFLAEASRAFNKVQRVPVKALPKGCQVEHIELYDLQDKRLDF